MARPRSKRPAYSHHKASGQARVRINGKDHYLGPYDSDESKERYEELVTEHLVNLEIQERQRGNVKKITLAALLLAWWQECKRRYHKGKGKLGGATNWRPIIRVLREAHGDDPADELGPVALRKAIQDAADANEWSLPYARKQLARVKQIYKWGVGEELIAVAAYQRLEVCEIREGRRTKPIPPVADDVVDATIPELKPVVQAMVRFQRLTGARPGEVVAMRTQDIDRSGDVWVYTPASHKTEHHGKGRAIYIGPRAQQIVATWMMKAEGDCIFPANRRDPYSSDSYRRAIHRAVRRINRNRAKEAEKQAEETGVKVEPEQLPKWSPNQLRKAAATSIRSALDVEHAASVLGHSSSVVTQDHYAHADRQRAMEAARKLG